VLEEYVKKLNPEDLLFFFMAGHGAPENADPANPRPPFYYITSDTKISDIAHTALPMTWLRNKLTKEARVKRIISIIDTCHSGGFGQEDNKLAMRLLTNDLTNQYFESSLYGEEGLAVITSSDINEVSYEDQTHGHGIFTFHALQGLKGSADTNRDKIVTVGELVSYVQKEVPTAVEKLKPGSSQHPRAALSNNDRLQLAVVLSNEATRSLQPTTNRPLHGKSKK
jgi:uncharacterized caspase-like protein